MHRLAHRRTDGARASVVHTIAAAAALEQPMLLPMGWRPQRGTFAFPPAVAQQLMLRPVTEYVVQEWPLDRQIVVVRQAAEIGLAAGALVQIWKQRHDLLPGPMGIATGP
eukprot:111447-Lingulodinium_polyedra.AAC.1